MQNIEGLPLGTKATHFIRKQCLNVVEVEIEPDNVYGVLDLTTVKIPNGYQRLSGTTDWFRVPNKLEDYLAVFSRRFTVGQFTVGDDAWMADKRRIILEPIKQTRRVLVVEHYLGVEEVSPITVLAGLGYSVPFRIEEREI